VEKPNFASEKCARQLVSLPMSPELTGEQVGYVAIPYRNTLSIVDFTSSWSAK